VLVMLDWATCQTCVSFSCFLVSLQLGFSKTIANKFVHLELGFNRL
jgi:hypothetical protein